MKALLSLRALALNAGRDARAPGFKSRIHLHAAITPKTLLILPPSSLVILLRAARVGGGRVRRGLDDDGRDVGRAHEAVEGLEVCRHHLIEPAKLRVYLRGQLFVEREGLLGRLRVGARD